MLSTRAATPDDYAIFSRFFPQLAVPDPLPSLDKWAVMAAHALFLERAGEAIAYAYAQKLGETGYVYHVVVDEWARGSGVGRTVMHAIASRLRAAGCTRWCLNVKPDNTPAIRLYERCGMKLAYRSTALSIAWTKVDALPLVEARWRRAEASEDPFLERAFGLPEGRVTVLRAQPNRIVLRIDEGSAIAGVAVFDPTFPGAFPFRVARPELARALLEAMRAHKREAHDHVRFVAEDDEPLLAAMLAAGAERTMDVFHMRGDIPAD
jgi:GNAT superfamily N-acetyltransferase